jgi:hypothetical protein
MEPTSAGTHAIFEAKFRAISGENRTVFCDIGHRTGTGQNFIVRCGTNRQQVDDPEECDFRRGPADLLGTDEIDAMECGVD